MSSDPRSAPGIPSGTGGLPNCRCCHRLGWIPADTHLVCTDPHAHTAMPRLTLAGETAYECPHCADHDPTLELPAATAARHAAVITLARAVTAPIYRRGVHRAVLRALRAEFAIDDARTKEQPNA